MQGFIYYFILKRIRVSLFRWKIKSVKFTKGLRFFMSRVTLLDIAKAAGVSHGTVSNVLNNKGNVSLEKIKKVKAVANKLGYKISHTARALRSGQENNVVIILPS